MSEDLNLGAAISRAVAAKLDAEFIEKEVETRVGRLVVEAVDRALRSYSDTGRMIEEKVEEALRVNDLDLPSYGAVVAQMLKTQIEAKVSEVVAGKLSQDMDELLKLAPKEIRLSEIAAEMLKGHRDDGAWGELITVIVEHSDHIGAWVYLDEEEVLKESDKHRCRYRLGIDPAGKIFSASIWGLEMKERNYIGRSYGFEQKLRSYVACGTKIILDEEFVETGIGDY